MFGGNSITLFHVRGIRIAVDWSWFVVLFLMIFWLSDFYGTSRQIDWGGLMAGSILAAIPVLIFFVIVQRRIAFGLTAGAVKG